MSGFRDIHTHFIYGLDDGAKTKEDMEAMLDATNADGIAFLWATPHVIPGIKPFDDKAFELRLELARAYCRQKAYPITLYKGAEILYTPVIEQYAVEQRIPTLGDTKNILLEFTPRISYANCKCKLDTRMIKFVRRKPDLSITQQERLALSRMP